MVLRAIVAQHLVVADGAATSRTPAEQAGRRQRQRRGGPLLRRRSRMVTSEVLMVTPAVANLIATAKSNQISLGHGVGRGGGHADPRAGPGPPVGHRPDFRGHRRGHGAERGRAPRPRRADARPAGRGTANHKGIVMNETVKPAADGEVLDMDTVRIDPAWALRMPASLALRRQVLPFASVGGQVYVACLDVADSGTLEAVERHVRLPDLRAAGRAGLAAAGVEPGVRRQCGGCAGDAAYTAR